MQGFPDLRLINLTVRAGIKLQPDRLQTQSVGVSAIDANHIALMSHRITAAKRLHQSDKCGRRNRHRVTHRHQTARAIPGSGEYRPFFAGHEERL